MGYIFSSLGLFHRKTSDIVRGYVARRTTTHKIVEIIVGVAILISAFFIYRMTAYSATFTFTQTSWSGGVSATNATHPTDKTGWNKYSAIDSSVAVVNSGADLQLATSSGSTVQTTDTDFNAGTYSSTVVSGSGSSAGVVLGQAAPAYSGATTFTSDGTFTASSTTFILIKAWGAGGAGSRTKAGGAGGFASGTMFVTSGQQLSVYVGAKGNYTSVSTAFCGGGGGYSGVFNGTSTQGNAIIIAGAGAGANDGGDGGYGGGTSGSMGGGYGNTANGGGGGTQNAGGAAGPGRSPTAVAGMALEGGRGGGTNGVITSTGGFPGGGNCGNTSGDYGGGGGGGGYYGGGGGGHGGNGSDGGGGGGGSGFLGSSLASGSFITASTAASSTAPNTGDTDYSAGIASGGGTTSNGGNGRVVIRYASSTASSGTFTSSVINTGQRSLFSTLSYTKTTPTNTTLTVDVRAGNTASPDGTWTSWQSSISNGGSISALDGNQYVQYRANLSNTDASSTPTLSDVTFNYYNYPYETPGITATTSDLVATGGTITNIGGYTIHTFNSSSTFQVVSGSSTLEYFIVAGGGGGGLANGGGGGAGGVLSGFNTVTTGSFPIVVGGGGLAGQEGSFNGSNGENSSFNSYTAIGGGGGTGTNNTVAGSNGGSGGGGGYHSGSGGSGVSGQGYAGGTGVFSPPYPGGGGGGAGGSGSSASGSTGGSGGPGVSSLISGSSIYYAAGGGGAGLIGGLVGTGGAGSGGSASSPVGGSGRNNSGDGGGGGYASGAAGNGGSGVVVLRYSLHSTVTSSAYNSASSGNVLGHISWTATTPTGTAVKFQIRSAPDSAGSPGTWSGWMGPDGTSATYFTDNTGGETMPTALRDGSNDQWFQYKVFLSTTNPSATPTLSDVSITYVVNAPPEFDATYGTNGIYVQQVSTSSDSTFGLTNIQYKIRDSDTLSGSVTPALVTPSFYYNIGGGWVSIPAQYLSSTSTDNKTVAEVAYNLYHALWDAKSQIPGTYSASAQVRVNLNDNEGANNTSSSTSATFVLDTANPSVTANIDGVAGTVNISATDNSQIINYNISNSSDMSSATTGSGTSTSFALSTPWTFSNSSSSATVYTTIRDKYNNVATTTIVAPIVPTTGMDIRDVSKPANNSYQEMLLWPTYVSGVTGATFQDYKLYRSTDGNSYSLLTTITNPATNYYLDATVNGSSTYYYKVKFTDTDGDTSAYSNVVTDLPDGQGGTDNTAPTISNVVISDIKNTSAKVTWTTDELANSKAEFGVSTAYGSQNTDQSYTTSHSVYITGLTSDTSYKVRVKSTDPAGNIGTNDNGGAGYSLTTVGGPVITNVTVSDISDSQATIFWNTSLSSDSYVDYSTNSDLSNYAEGGSADLVTGTSTVYQHKVTITGLSGASTYYFQVSSREGGGSQTIDTNHGSYYQFRTTYDTKAPTITEVQTPVRASDSAVITWKTDELSDSQIEFGTTASTTHGGYAKTTTLVTTPTIFHSITLSRQTTDLLGDLNTLVKSSTYYYRVISKDGAGNTSYSSEGTFDTTADGAVIYASTGGGSAATAVTQADVTPPTITDVHVDHITPFGATIIFNTSEDARGLVQYGEDEKDLNTNASDSVFSSKHTIEIRGLKMGTTYTYLVDAIDKSGNVGFAERATFKTPFLSQDLGTLQKLNNTVDTIQQKIEDIIESALPSINPPFIDKPTIDAVGEDFVTISFHTNVKAYGLVSYATDDDYQKDGKYTQEESKLDTKSVDHTLDLSGLKSNTKYHFGVKAYVFPGAPAQTEDMTFITSASKIDARITERKIDSFHVVWTTDAPSTSVVEYKKKGSVKAEKKSDDAMTTYHDVLVDHLTPATTYEVRPYSVTKDGNVINPKNSLIVTTIKDITPPAISGFKVDSALVTGRNDRTQTIVSWKTDEPATSVVYYEEGSGAPNKALANKQEDLSSYTQNHVVILTSLKPGSIYRFQIASSDEAGNMTKLPIRTIVTPKANESVVDVIFKNFDDTFNFIKKTQ